MQIDPTRTKMLRLQYQRQLTKLYTNLRKRIIQPLVQYTLNNQIKARQLDTAADTWLEWEIQREILTPTERVIYNNLRPSYWKGKKKAIKNLVPIEAAENMTPLDWEALHTLEEINFNRIKDCTQRMKQAITYACNQGVLNGWGAGKIASELRKAVAGNNNMGIKRARMIARTEVINAYNTGAVNTYKSAGLKESEIIWITAFDERTCPICAGYDGMSIKEVGEKPPVHPN